MRENLSKLKVIMVVNYYPPLTCGIGDYTACLSKELALRDVDVTVLATRVPGVVTREVCDKIDIRRVVEGWYMSEVRTILAVVKEKGPNAIIHLQYPSKGYYRRPMINLLPAIVRLAMPRSPVVVTMHGFHEYRLLWRLRAMPMVIAANARILVHSKDYEIVTRWAKPFKFLTELIPIGSNIPVVPESPTIRAQLREQHGFNRDDTVIVFFGDMRPDKGFLEFLRAIRAIRSEGIAFCLLVISRLNDTEAESPYCREVRKALESSKTEKCVSVVDAPEPEMASRMLQLADLAVFPFTMGASENRGSLLAAIAHGIPTITTRGPSTPERFEEDYGVETVLAGDYEALACRIGALVRSPKLCEELRCMGMEAAPRFPSWGAVAFNTIALYRRLLRSDMAIFEGNK